MNSLTHPSSALTGVKAVILVGAEDFGRCPLATHLNRACWPVFGKPALQRTIELLREQGLSRFVVCRQSDAADKSSGRAFSVPGDADITLLNDPLPRGPAGCLRDAVDFVRDDLLLVMPAGLVSPPDVGTLIAQHRQADAPVSVFLNPKSETAQYPMEAGIYLCSPEAIRLIGESGYMDLKEGLIRELARLGKPARAFYLDVDAGNFRTWQEYVDAVGLHLVRHAEKRITIAGFAFDPDRLLWTGDGVTVCDSARVIGPAVIGPGTRIEEDVVLRGPVVIDRDVRIGPSAVVDASVIWAEAAIGPGARVDASLIDAKKVVPAGSDIHGRLSALPPKPGPRLINRWQTWRIPRRRMEAAPATPAFYSNRALRTAQGLLLALLVLLLYTYRQTLADLWSVWMRSDEYSSGLLVPFLAGYILWIRRMQFKQAPPAGPCLWGLAALAAVQGLRWWGYYYRFDSLQRLSLVLSAGALALTFIGPRTFRRLLPVYLFLFLMLPLPKQVEMQMTIPLQRWATASAVFSLETLGFDSWQEGNIIHINDTQVAVAEACNGLRMLTAFLVVSGMVVLIVRRSWRQKLFILLSSMPIALLCNTIRLAVTAALFTVIDAARWERAFHDFGGFAMMPLALGIIVLELWVLSGLMIGPGRASGQPLPQAQNSQCQP